MSENRPAHPEADPAGAAQEVVLKIIESGALERVITSSGALPKESASDFLISIHKDLTAYYKTLIE